MEFESKITSVFAQMHQSASFGVRHNTAEVIIGLVDQFPNSIIVNVVADEIDVAFDNALKKQFRCVYDRNIEFLEVPETTIPPAQTTASTQGVTDKAPTPGTDYELLG